MVTRKITVSLLADLFPRSGDVLVIRPKPVLSPPFTIIGCVVAAQTQDVLSQEYPQNMVGTSDECSGLCVTIVSSTHDA
jgi:hypothetical protein